ncbi:MAG: ribosome-binding factor A [Saprospiraceae bacterium]|jgi:ribosome-binding factor A|nr:ribosome-binding factor A [Saprospiraceae bacterium]MBP9193943.1 ribosome-binding factor A [Saprospiraceae bacterium]
METKRQLQLGELIKRNFSTVLQQEGRYIYGDVLVSVTKAIISPDLSQVKIYLSIYGTEEKEEILQNIENQTFQLKQGLAHRIKSQIRRIPEIYLYLDDTLDEMYRVDGLLDRIK